MKTLNELIVHLNKKNISNKLVNNQVLINRKDYNFCLINEISKEKSKIESFYLDSTMIFYINTNL